MVINLFDTASPWKYVLGDRIAGEERGDKGK
jgi:hypothetical protein